MATQTTPLGLGRTETIKVDGYKLGRSRTSRTNAGLACRTWGSQVPIGRLVVFSPAYNIAVAAGEDNPERTVCLPDANGDYIVDPVSGLLLKDADPQLLANLKVDDEYRVAGIMVEGDQCDEGKCFQPQPWPLGNHDRVRRWNYVAANSAGTFDHHGYCEVQIGEDLVEGDELAFLDAFDDVDPNVGVQTFGYFVKKGNGVQDLPSTWKVIKGGKAGTSAEIYVGS